MISTETLTKECIGIELGGTFTKVALGEIVYENNIPIKFNILQRQEFNTGYDPKETIENVLQWIKKFKFTHLGIASFGPICLVKSDPLYGCITSTPKLKWKNTQILSEIKKQINIDSYGFDTDVNSCALAEFQLGNHNVKTSLAYITIGTGVGVGLICNGKSIHGLVHPEGGHIRVKKLESDKNFLGVCSFHGDCLEGLCTNVSIAQRLEKQIYELDKVEDQNPVWQQVGYYIANLCLNITLIASVEVIIIGGGVMNRKCLYPIIRSEFKYLMNGYIDHPLMRNLDEYIKSPALGNDVGLVGAMILEN